jgi:trimeric autotransporter adhesin
VLGTANRPSRSETTRREKEKFMLRTTVCLTVCLLMITCTLPLAAQNSAVTGAVVPRLVNYSGRVLDVDGKPLVGIAGVTFSIYKDQYEGSPLWLETQNVTANSKGNYTIQLGATRPEGLPLELFSSGEARWLGVRVNGGEEAPRALLLSVPYALKAADAETIGGLPPSAFVLAAPASSLATASVPAVTAQPLATGTTPVTTAGGTVNTLAKFDANADITSSVIFDNGTSVGVGNTAPAAKLDVSGTSIFRGLLTLPAVSAATASTGKNSQPINLTASSYNSSAKKAVNETFRWQAEPVGNDSTTPSGKLNLLFGSGSATPTETGLSISSLGLITFAAGQTFPSGSGSVTSVGLTAPSSDFTVSGSPVTTSGTLNFAWNVAPTNAATANAIVKRDSTGSFSAGSITASLGVTGASTAVGVYGESTGTVSGDNGVQGVTFAGPGSGVAGFNNSGAPGSIGVYGQGDTAIYAYGTTTGVFGHGSAYGFATDGNVQQARTGGGWVKALAVVQGLNAPYTITRCFNSFLTGAAATTPPCGFNLTEVQPGLFNIDFGFQMNDRFIMATLVNSSSACTLYAAYTPDVETSGQLLCGFGGSYTPFVGTVAVF